MTSAISLAASGASDVASGAVLTLVLPVGCVIIMLAIWYFAVRSGRQRGR
jgi:hypothetical protein